MDSTPKDEQELTRCVVHFLNIQVLKGEDRVPDGRDIERCHFVSKPKSTRAQQILVKFSRYHDKWRVFSSKKSLKSHPNKTFIAEDLTSMNHSVINSLLPLKKDGFIDSFWTRDGRIIVKKSKTENPVRIDPADNIKFSLGLVPTEDGDDAEIEPMSGQ